MNLRDRAEAKAIERYFAWEEEVHRVPASVEATGPLPLDERDLQSDLLWERDWEESEREYMEVRRSG